LSASDSHIKGLSFGALRRVVSRVIPSFRTTIISQKSDKNQIKRKTSMISRAYVLTDPGLP
jgi:hypothetical protein